MNTSLVLGAMRAADRDVQTLALERHALTIAGSRMGKGACQIIPTLRTWTSSAVVLDPKGEAALNTVEERRAMGQDIAILDPMRLLPENFDPYRRCFDPLSLVRSGGAGFRDLMMIADGMVLATGEERDPHWNESALNTIAGCLAYLVESKREPSPHLGQLPLLVRLLRNPDKRPALLDVMAECRDFGGLAADTASLFAADTNESNGILSTTGRHIRFLSDSDIAAAVRPSTTKEPVLDLTQLRDGTLTLYLVIDPGALVLHARFLRLFVRLALAVMMRTQFEAGQSGNAPCLFVLDEFYSLGRINDVQKAAGLMPGYGVHLWPILQDWGQLVDLYDEHGAQTFLANADAVAVFGVSDQTTLQEVSKWFGEASVDELEEAAIDLARKIETSETWRNLGRAAGNTLTLAQNQQLLTQTALLQGRIGRPKRYPADIQAHVAKPFGANVAERMFVFLRTREILDLVPRPYFQQPKKRGLF